jgi:hypothetical protein
MHFYWTRTAADLLRAGDRSMTRVLENAAAGHVFAAGHGEACNGIPSCCRPPRPVASRAAGSSPDTRSSAACRRSGPTSASTRWTPPIPPPHIVHAFLPPRAVGYRIEPTWNTLGVRATESNDTVLDSA